MNDFKVIKFSERLITDIMKDNKREHERLIWINDNVMIIIMDPDL